MQLNLNDAQLQTVVAGAVMQMLTPENREALIKEAVANLLKPQADSSFGRKAISPLQEAFSNVVRQIAFDTMKTKFETDVEFKAQIDGVFVDAVKKAMEKREVMVTKMAEAITAFMDLDRRY